MSPPQINENTLQGLSTNPSNEEAKQNTWFVNSSNVFSNANLALRDQVEQSYMTGQLIYVTNSDTGAADETTDISAAQTFTVAPHAQ